jgi:hypothetical protein
MDNLNLRKRIYFSLAGLRGQELGLYYERILQEFENGVSPDTIEGKLAQLLENCKY